RLQTHRAGALHRSVLRERELARGRGTPAPRHRPHPTRRELLIRHDEKSMTSPGLSGCRLPVTSGDAPATTVAFDSSRRLILEEHPRRLASKLQRAHERSKIAG